MFQKILIANRGEIAVRVIRACQTLGIQTVAVYSEADAHALHVRLADEAVYIGAAPSADSYLRGDRIILAAQQTGAEAIHPGYGFLSENAEFAEMVERSGLIFIGPPPSAIRVMGSKTEARQRMQAVGVPVVPGFQGAVSEFAAQAEQIGYPVLVKAAAGGGGKGMRVVNEVAELQEAIETAQREALKSFGDDTLFLEKYLPIAHHIEYQILADAYGNTVHLFERECSLQRRHQKIIEETPSPLLTPEIRAEMGAAAIAAAQSVAYQNAGTIEFIADEQGQFYFLEMNTRLQVEHPITEMVTGLDLVRLQIQIAAGKPLPFTQADLTQHGHALECRIYAEDPANHFLPAIGDILKAVPPQMPNIRVDYGVESGDVVSLHYDPMIAKIISYGRTRQQAIQTMLAALKQYVLLGVTNNIPFLIAVLEHEAFQMGNTPTNFIPTHFTEWQPPALSELEQDIALIAAALQEGLPTSAPAAQAATGDVYSPWNQTDHFRMGK